MRIWTVYTLGIGPVVSGATDGGAHSAETYARMFAQFVVQIPDYFRHFPAKLAAAEAFQASVIRAIEPIAQSLIDHERRRLAGAANDAGEPDDGDACADAADAVIECACGTPWQAKYAAPGMREALADEFAHKFPTIRDVERRWAADRHAIAS